jgi:3',5'-cyclic-AMP phosphodiesterase
MNFSFVQITDHHLTAAETDRVHGCPTRQTFRAVLRQIAQTRGPQIDFIVSTGDLVEVAATESYRAVGQMLAVQNTAAAAPGPVRISAEGLHNFPLYVLPGNHDDRDTFFTGLFPDSPPQARLNATFRHRGLQFICLDWGPDNKAAAEPDMLDFLARALDTALPSIILMHHHVIPIGVSWLDSFIADEVDRFWATVTGRPVLGIFCGHVHTTYDQVVGGIPVFGLRSTAFSFAPQDEPVVCLLPPQYRVITVQDGSLTTEVVEVQPSGLT